MLVGELQSRPPVVATIDGLQLIVDSLRSDYHSYICGLFVGGFRISQIHKFYDKIHGNISIINVMEREQIWRIFQVYQ